MSYYNSLVDDEEQVTLRGIPPESQTQNHQFCSAGFAEEGRFGNNLMGTTDALGTNDPFGGAGNAFGQTENPFADPFDLGTNLDQKPPAFKMNDNDNNPDNHPHTFATYTRNNNTPRPYNKNKRSLYGSSLMESCAYAVVL